MQLTKTVVVLDTFIGLSYFAGDLLAFRTGSVTFYFYIQAYCKLGQWLILPGY